MPSPKNGFMSERDGATTGEMRMTALLRTPGFAFLSAMASR